VISRLADHYCVVDGVRVFDQRTDLAYVEAELAREVLLVPDVPLVEGQGDSPLAPRRSSAPTTKAGSTARRATGTRDPPAGRLYND
jgi:hypothetical protein